MFDRSRWITIGAAVAVIVGGGLAIPAAQATISSGERLVFVAITPCRVLDTRPAPETVGGRATPLTAQDVLVQPIRGTNGNCTIPVDASAVSINVTIADGSAASFLTVWPADAPRPLASNLNWSAGSGPIPNKVDVKLSADGQIRFFNNGGTVNVLADIVGYYVDHNHDDRYYSKAQTDAAYAAAAHAHDDRYYSKAQTDAAYAAAAHTHDDRYYSKAQVDAAVAAVDDSLRTDTYSPFALQNFNPGTQAFLPIAGSCITNGGNSGNGVTFLVPIVVPVGARLISADVTTYDGINTPLSIKLWKQTLTATGSTIAEIAAGAGGAGAAALDRDLLTPSPTEIATASESFYVELANLLNGNGFCALTVTYDTDG